jgi:hypothetical protein
MIRCFLGKSDDTLKINGGAKKQKQKPNLDVQEGE